MKLTRANAGILSVLAGITALALAGCRGAVRESLDITQYGSIQEALDRNAGRMLLVPPGTHEISKAIHIQANGSGLYGPGTIVQTNPDEHIVVIQSAEDVRLEGLALKRIESPMGKRSHAVLAEKCRSLWLKDLRILDNRSDLAAVLIKDSRHTRIEGCEIVNYKTIAVDDRVNDPLYQYAFNAINGHGIRLVSCRSTQVLHNRVIENDLLPTKEIQEKYALGKIVSRKDKLGPLASYGVADDAAFIWHQGAGIQMSDAEQGAFAHIEGNYLENPAQGLDIHCDFATITGNQVTNSYIGIKSFHGSRGVLIADNIIHAPGKYGILLRPGSGAHDAELSKDGRAARGENVQRGIIISGNIISHMGHGVESWRLWNEDPKASDPVAIKLGSGPLPENGVLMDVLLVGNIVMDSGVDEIPTDSARGTQRPLYKWALWYDEAPPAQNVRVQANILHPGRQGVSNRPPAP